MTAMHLGPVEIVRVEQSSGHDGGNGLQVLSRRALMYDQDRDGEDYRQGYDPGKPQEFGNAAWTHQVPQLKES